MLKCPMEQDSISWPNFPDKDFDVVFITAFNHYAIKAIKFSAVDYILKPININEFIEAVNRVIRKRSDKSVYRQRKPEDTP